MRQHWALRETRADAPVGRDGIGRFTVSVSAQRQFLHTDLPEVAGCSRSSPGNSS
jgi:hypothetical protein